MAKAVAALATLLRVFALKGMTDQKFNYEVIKILIDRLNTMVACVAGEFLGRVHYVDLRPVLEADPKEPSNFELLWDNELHPTQQGYRRVAQAIAQKLDSLGVPAAWPAVGPAALVTTGLAH